MPPEVQLAEILVHIVILDFYGLENNCLSRANVGPSLGEFRSHLQSMVFLVRTE